MERKFLLKKESRKTLWVWWHLGWALKKSVLSPDKAANGGRGQRECREESCECRSIRVLLGCGTGYTLEEIREKVLNSGGSYDLGKGTAGS